MDHDPELAQEQQDLAVTELGDSPHMLILDFLAAWPDGKNEAVVIFASTVPD